jgi:hypothetical protein
MAELIFANSWSSPFPSPLPCRLKPSIHPFTNQASFKISESGKNPERAMAREACMRGQDGQAGGLALGRSGRRLMSALLQIQFSSYS